MRVAQSARLLPCLLLIVTATAAAQAEKTNTDVPDIKPADTGIPIEKVIAAVARKDGHRFIVDPRVRASVQIVGQDISTLTLAQLQTILAVYGFVATESSGYVTILPDASARQVVTPLLTGNEKYPDAEVVTAVFQVKNIPAAQLVPILRPLIPQYGQLAAFPYNNSLLITDRFANLKRIEAIAHSLDIEGSHKPESCNPPATDKESH